MDFIEISIKSNQNYHTGVKITKLGREIIEISIISPVQTHKLSLLQGINQNFDLFPQKWVLKQVFTPIWGYHWVKFHQYLPSLHSFKVISLHNSAGVCNTHGSKYILSKYISLKKKKKKLTLKHLNVKSYYFGILAQVLKLLHTTAQAQYFTKIQNSNNFLTNTINTTAQSTAVFSTNCSLIVPQ